MGKNYFCDYCQRSFSDVANNRKKHLQSVSHQRVRKEHYDQYKSAEELLKDDQGKNPCRRFLERGSCDFGNSCRYSHLTDADINSLLLEVQQSKNKVNNKDPDLKSWLSRRAKRNKEEETIDEFLFRVPEILKGRHDLPPSLLPPDHKETEAIPLSISRWGWDAASD